MTTILTCPNSGDVACGSAGCLPSSRCCLPFGAGWTCGSTHSCITVTGTVNCIEPSLAHTMANTCNDYTSLCTSSYCFRCSDTLLPLCYQLMYTSGNVVLWKSSCGTTSHAVTIHGDTSTTETSSSTSTAGGISSVPSTTSPGPAPETSPPAPQQSSSPAAASGISTGAIVGIVIGSCALLVLVAILFVVLRRRKVAVPAMRESGAVVPGLYVPELEGLAIGIVPVKQEPERAELM